AQPFRRKTLWKSVRGAQWAPFIMPLSFVNLLASFFPHQKLRNGGALHSRFAVKLFGKVCGVPNGHRLLCRSAS
ncbi:MAG: hypothetical protein J6C30_09645, partial [Lentisphaeria bacterium]|nr:hypothetical protein [Lentisphaeria bacterium]